ncbi:MAG TPA: hypothetical protein VFX97_09125 [Pyrinomonadaceae bacterium]|nr:hypothetical protein [Pyrinomonadaceae bacterium]
MKNRIKLCLQVTWVTAVFVVLAMSFNFCAATDHACFEAVDRMFLMMMVLSFPAGIIGLGVASFFLWPLLSVDQLYDNSIFWLAMAGAGYLQWFVILPRVFTKRKFTTLNLRETKTGLGETKTDFEEPKKVVQVTPREVPRLTRTQRQIRRIRAYDKLGRTPLERALRSRSTDASA